MKLTMLTLLLTCLASHAAVSLTNEFNPTDNRDVLGDSNSFGTVTVTQNFTVGDAQSPGAAYDFNFLSFNVELAGGPAIINSSSNYQASLSGGSLASGIVEDFVPISGIETVTFASAPAFQLIAGETYTLTLTMRRADDDNFNTLSVDYTEFTNETATGDAGETINNWSIANGSSTTGGLFVSPSQTVEMTLNVTSVPEPSSALLMGLGAIALLRRRRR